MRDLLQPADPGAVPVAEQRRREEFIAARAADRAEADMNIGAEQFVFWIGDTFDAIELVPLISAIARGDTFTAIQFCERLRGQYTEALQESSEFITEVMADYREEHGHA